MKYQQSSLCLIRAEAIAEIELAMTGYPKTSFLLFAVASSRERVLYYLVRGRVSSTFQVTNRVSSLSDYARYAKSSIDYRAYSSIKTFQTGRVFE